jgi:NADH-quinone oxidoreductase subunit G
MCLVEIEKMPKLQIGCATQVAQGMVVKTTTDKVKTTREGIMEFLLINHPLDCPICDQAGECRLQQYSNTYGTGQSRFVEEKIHHDKRQPIGARILFDGERCIKCTRCIRFCDEVSRTGELGLFDRGGHSIVAAFPGKPLDNDYSGNTVDICPVGALTWKPFRFDARVWFLRDVPAICSGCARGCNVNAATYQNQIHRLTPRQNPDVNGYWMCDAGRQTYEPPKTRRRLDRPRARDGAADPFDAAAAALRAVASRHGAGALAALISARLTVEDLYVAARTLAALGIQRIVVPPHEEGKDDALLIRRDRTPNGRGAALLGLGAPDAAATAALAGDLVTGKVRGLVVVGEDPAGDGILRPEALGSLEALVAADWWASPTVEAAHVALPICAWGESDGVFVNFQGRAQRTRRAIRPQGAADPAWRVLADLGLRFGMAGSYASSSAIFDEVAARVPAFAGLSYRALGLRGAMVREG